MKARWWRAGHHETEGAGKFETLLKTFQEIRQVMAMVMMEMVMVMMVTVTLPQESVHYLLDEAFLDIESYFSDLVTPKWQAGSQAVDTICITLNDYFEDYQFLKKTNFELVISCAQVQEMTLMLALVIILVLVRMLVLKMMVMLVMVLVMIQVMMQVILLVMMLVLMMSSCPQDRVARKFITAMLQNNLLRRKVTFTR